MKVPDLNGRELPVIGLDFETYYESEKGARYTLSKLSTTEYVRHPKFRAHGVGVRFPEDKAAWWVSHCDLNDFLRSIDWSQYALLCQNTAFDGLILSHHFGQVPAYYLDTLSMSRGEFGPFVPHDLSSIGARLDLGTKIAGTLASTANIYRLPWAMEKDLAVYGNRDVDLMWEAFDKFYYERNYPEKELHIIDQTIRCFCDPILQVNEDLCIEEAESEAAGKSRLVALADVDPKRLSSNKQFAELLEEHQVEVPMKISKTTKKPTYAFAKTDLEFIELEKHPVVGKYVKARRALKSTIGATRASRLIKHAKPSLPILMNYCQALTHRWSGGDKMNPQNLPSGRKPGQSNRLRRSIEAPRGWRVVVADSSQIECRTNAYAAGEEGLLTEFRDKLDPYSRMAEGVYHYPVNKKDNPDERFLGKCLELGAGYGMWANTFQHTVQAGMMGPPMDISIELATEAILAYRDKRKKIAGMWDVCDEFLDRMSRGERFDYDMWEFHGTSVLMPNGLFIHYNGLSGVEGARGIQYSYYGQNSWVNIYGAKFLENLIQSTARTIVANQAIEIARYFKILWLVHDEIIFLARENEADDALKYAIEVMRKPSSFAPTLPLDAEGGHAHNYSK